MSADLTDVPTVSVEDVSVVESQNLLQYDRETMLKLTRSPLSKQRPGYLSEEFDRIVSNENETGDGPSKLWGPDLWIESIWKKESMSSGGGVNLRPHRGGSVSAQRSMNGADASRRKQGVDRLKSEHKDGIVLSPQRRSFGAGCQAPPAAMVTSSTSSANTSSQNSNSGVAFNSQRRSVSPNRNGGSGISDYDVGPMQQQHASSRNSKPRQNAITSSYSDTGRGGGGNRGRADGGFHQQAQRGGGMPQQEQSGGGGGFQSSRVDRVENWRDRNQWSNSNDGGRDYHNRRGMSNGGRFSYRADNDLPEWATDGPSDMHDTIELHGFDDEFDENAESSMGGGMKDKNFYHRSNSESSSSNYHNHHHQQRNDYSRDKPLEQYKFSANAVTDADVRKNLVAPDVVETIHNGGDVAAGGISDKSHKDTPGTSRFSKFFGKGSSDKNNNNKSASSEQDSHDAAEQRKSSGGGGQQQPSNSVMEFLSKAKINVVQQERNMKSASAASSSATGGSKLPEGAMNLEDLEAILVHKKHENVAKMSPNVAKPADETTHHGSGQKSILQDLFKSANFNHQQTPPASAAVPASSMATVDAASSNAAAATSSRVTKMQIVKGNPLADPNQQQHLLEALQKLQVQQQTDPSQQHAQQQSHMPFALPQTSSSATAAQQIQQSHPNLLQAMLAGKIAGTPGADALLANMIHHHQQQQQQHHGQAAALGSSGMQASSPQPTGATAAAMSQQDLLVNAQMLYQKALLNRKIEEQKENYAKRQQQHENSMMDAAGGQQSQHLPPAGNVGKSAAYSSFLPTSVLKNMHGVAGGGGKQPPINFASHAKEAADLHKNAQAGNLPGNSAVDLSSPRPIVGKQQQQPPPSAFGQPPPSMIGNTAAVPAGQPTNAAAAAHPQDVIRFMHQQQQAAQQMQLLRLQQLQMLQQLGGAGLMQAPRMVNNKPMSNEEYQQILAMTLLQQQQQQQQIRAAATVPPAMPAGVDMMRQRAMMAAAAQQQQQMTSQHHHQQQQQQQLINQFRPQNYPSSNAANVNASQQQQNETNLRSLFSVGNFASSTVVFPPMPVGGGGTNGKPITLDEIERMQQKQQTPSASSSNYNNQ